MDEGRTATGHSADATVSFFRPARNSFLLLLGALAIAGAVLAVLEGRTPGLGVSIRFAVMVFAAVAIALSQFRDPFLAASAALAPLPGVSLIFCGMPSLPLPPPARLLAALVYALGFAFALVMGGRFAALVADGEDPEASAKRALWAEPRLFASVLIFAGAMPLTLAIVGPAELSARALLLAGSEILAVLSAWLAVPLAGSFMGGGEDFIARTNRTQESWERRLDRIAKSARSPWALSTSGIFVVLLTLALFGSAGIAIMRGMAKMFRLDAASAGIVLLMTAFLATREWRRTVAVWLATAGAVLFAVWGYAREGAVLDAPLALLTAALCANCFLPIAAVAAAAPFSTYEDRASASGAGIRNAGAGAATGIAAALVLLLPWYREIGMARAGFILALAFAAGGALIFQPAIANALEDFVPRRQGLAERYRVK